MHSLACANTMKLIAPSGRLNRIRVILCIIWLVVEGAIDWWPYGHGKGGKGSRVDSRVNLSARNCLTSPLRPERQFSPMTEQTLRPPESADQSKAMRKSRPLRGEGGKRHLLGHGMCHLQRHSSIWLRQVSIFSSIT
jgi:hypothetical protein